MQPDAEIVQAFLAETAGLSQEEIEAIAEGITQTDVSRWRRDDWQRLTAAKRRAVLRFLEERRRAKAVAQRAGASVVPAEAAAELGRAFAADMYMRLLELAQGLARDYGVQPEDLLRVSPPDQVRVREVMDEVERFLEAEAAAEEAAAETEQDRDDGAPDEP